MKNLLIVLFLLNAQAISPSPFDGTWIVDENVWLPKGPQEFSLSKGLFHCTFYSGNETIKADGENHKVPETSYWDTVSVRVVDARAVEIVAKKAGKTMYAETDTVSPDGETLTQVLTDTTESQPIVAEIVSQRMGKAPTESHALSGSWHAYKIKRSKIGSIITYKCTAEGFSSMTPLGEGFDAKFDGKDYPVEDDPAHTTVCVKRLSPLSVELTFKRNAKVIEILHFTVEGDGKTIHVIAENKESNTSSSYDMQKQPQ